MLPCCCILQCFGPEGANLVRKGRTLPYCCIFPHLPSEMAVLTEAHHANVRFNLCIRKGANVATLLYCWTFPHFASEMAVSTEAHHANVRFNLYIRKGVNVAR